MSGYKRATVTISEEEYRRLHQADVKRRFKEHRQSAKATRQTADLTHTLREMENRQRQFERALGTLDQDLGWISAEMMQEVLAQNAHYYEGLVSVIDEMNTDANASLELLSQRVTEEIERERQQHRLHLQSLSQRLETFDQREHSRAEAARQWFKQSAAFADFIQEQLDHERFLPRQLSRIRASLELAQNNLVQGFFESSLQTSQQAFLALSELHFELEQRIVEWHTEFFRAQSTLSRFVSELEMNSKVNALGLGGEELTEQVDLAYWSNGKYHELLEKSRRLLMLLSREQRSISTEELKKTNKELLPVIREKFETIIYDARLLALNSQLRMNIAERALQALEIQGFELSESGYTNQDMRGPFSAHLENPDGSRVMIQVLPVDPPQQELTNELVVITNHPYLKTEQEARLQWQELCRSLNQYDLHVSRPELRPAPLAAEVDHAPRPAVISQPLIRSERPHNV